MAKARPVTLSSTTSAAYKGAGDPEPLQVVSGTTAGSPVVPVKQAGIADLAAVGLPADFTAVQTAIQADRTKINAIISALEAAGILVTV
jgi:hypothetical protein